MARVIGPMFCTWASGTFGNLITFHNRKEGVVVGKKIRYFGKLPVMAGLMKMYSKYSRFTNLFKKQKERFSVW